MDNGANASGHVDRACDASGRKPEGGGTVAGLDGRGSNRELDGHSFVRSDDGKAALALDHLVKTDGAIGSSSAMGKGRGGDRDVLAIVGT